MRKRKVLLAALLICFTLSLQEANATQSHLENTDLTNSEYKDYKDNTGGVLYVHDENTHNVTESTLKNNTATSSGGAVYNSATLNVKSSKFEENTASSSSHRGDGGAIYNEGIINIDDSSFTKNKAGSGEYWQEESNGGAIYNKKNASITNSTFTENHARYGGAIYNETGAVLSVQGTFTGNTAQTGGAINNKGELTVKSGSLFENNTATRFDGGAIVNADGTLNIEDDVTFRNNNAYEGDEKRGGAIQSEGDGHSKVTIGNRVTFEGNQAKEGGAIDLYKHNDVTIGENAVFKNNKALQNGGAINVFTLDDDAKASTFSIGNNALFEGNQAGVEGYQQSYVSGGAVTINDIATEEGKYSSFSIGDNAIFRNNKAKYDGDSVVYGYGGALYNAAFKTSVGSNALFDGNISDIGGAVYNQANLGIGQNAAFKNNNASLYGGAFYNCSTFTLGENALFDGNIATLGGAIYNSSMSENSILKAIFENNQASMGGAIYNNSYNTSPSTLNIADSVFSNNNAKSSAALNYGGAIYNQSNVNVTNSLFEGNSAGSEGGAIYNVHSNDDGIETKLTVDNSQFTKNKSVYGGAIAAYGKTTKTNVTKTTFNNNYAVKNDDGNGGQGGAIYTDGYTPENTLTVENSLFENNTSASEGGAIYSGGETTVTGSVFNGNRTTGTKFKAGSPDSSSDNEGGGAIFVDGKSKTTIENSDFINNYSSTVGGAIATRSNTDAEASSLTIKTSNFSGNSSRYNGGAIASYTDTTITDTSFVNNKSDKKGGAIWANGNVTVKAENSDIVFLGNSAEEGADIYMDTLSSGSKTGTLTLTAEQDKNITFSGGISGASQYNVDLNGEGEIIFNSAIRNAKMQVQKGTLHLAQGSSLDENTTINVTGATLDSQDGQINDYSGKVFMGQDSKLRFDLSSANKTTDKFSAASELGSGNVHIEDFNFIPDTKVSSGIMSASDIKDSLGLGSEVNLELPEKSFTTLTPLRYVNVKSGAEGITYTPTGDSYEDFNPAVTSAPVAALLGGYLTQLDTYDEAFRNMDMYMIMPKSMRQAMKFKNKYASADSDWNVIYDKAAAPYDNTALWARPYATFENVRLKRGPKVSNVSWGTFLGADSELFDMGNGWEGMWGVYAGYNGSHQAYNGISIYQNGGTLGLTGTLYKNNFFTGLTANAGANSAEASTRFGDDSFGLFRTGVASKTGYNIEFADGKFIIQPSWLMSYSFVNTEDYKTASGIRINSNPLNVLQLEPGLKFIGNVGKGWQPYTGLSIVWNLFDKTDFTASDATLPELSVKPFFKYGIGLRKLYGERFVGYGQTYFTSGGRNGMGVQLGGRWTI